MSEPIGQKPWLDDQQSPFISIQNITKRFDDFVAVDNISLDIFKGELFCLLGGSGSGKSTLLRVISGFEQQSIGDIHIDGQLINEVKPHKRPVNMMFQSYALFPHMTVEQNIGYGLKRDGLNKDLVRDKVHDMLALVQMDQFAQRKPHQLSGGQRQRVALARSIIKNPKVLPRWLTIQ